jgi:hypothetical protein
MATQNNPDVSGRPEPCVKRSPNDLILAEDWNEMQIQLLEQIESTSTQLKEALAQETKTAKTSLDDCEKNLQAAIDQKTNKTDFEQQRKEVISLRTDLSNTTLAVKEEWQKKAQELAEADNTLRDERTQMERHLRADLDQKANAAGSNSQDFASKDLLVAGHVGIGMVNPQKRLYVEGEAQISQTLAVDGAICLGNHSIYNDAEESFNVLCGNSRWLRLGSGGGIALWGDGQAAHNNTPNMVVDAKGHVGIGTTDPQKTLEVKGDVQAENLYLNGQIWLKNPADNAAEGGQAWIPFSVANAIGTATGGGVDSRTIAAIQTLRAEKNKEIQALQQENQALKDRLSALEAKLP